MVIRIYARNMAYTITKNQGKTKQYNARQVGTQDTICPLFI